MLPPRAPGEGPPAGEAGGDDLDGDGRRPADVFVPRWRGGTPAAWDFAVTSGLRADLLVASAAEGGGDAAATRYEEQKRLHQDTARCCSEAGLSFIPMVCEAHGGSWSPLARKVFDRAAKAQSAAWLEGQEPC